MKIGDLVWHVDDLADGLTVPGLVMGASDDDVFVLFADRQFNEAHTKRDLTAFPNGETNDYR